MPAGSPAGVAGGAVVGRRIRASGAVVVGVGLGVGRVVGVGLGAVVVGVGLGVGGVVVGVGLGVGAGGGGGGFGRRGRGGGGGFGRRCGRAALAGGRGRELRAACRQREPQAEGRPDRCHPGELGAPGGAARCRFPVRHSYLRCDRTSRHAGRTDTRSCPRGWGWWTRRYAARSWLRPADRGSVSGRSGESALRRGCRELSRAGAARACCRCRPACGRTSRRIRAACSYRTSASWARAGFGAPGPANGPGAGAFRRRGATAANSTAIMAIVSSR